MALATSQKLSADNPAVMTFRLQVADSLYQIGRTLADTARPDEALQFYERSLAAFRKLAEDDPQVANHLYGQGCCHEMIGQVMQATGRAAEAEQSYKSAIPVFQKLVDGSPKVTMFRDDLAAVHLYLGELYMTLGKPAEPEFRAAVAGYQRLHDETPADLVFQTYLARSRHGLAGLLRSTGRRPEAMESYRQALALRQRLAHDEPSDAERQSKLAETLNDTALCEMSEQRWTEAQHLLERAIEHERQAMSLVPGGSTYGQLLSNHLATLASVYRALAQPNHAVRAARELAELQRGDPNGLIRAARELSLTVPLMTAEAKPSLAAEAVSTLRQAMDAGWRDAVSTSRDPALTPLRARDDFRALLAELFDRVFPDDALAPANKGDGSL